MYLSSLNKMHIIIYVINFKCILINVPRFNPWKTAWLTFCHFEFLIGLSVFFLNVKFSHLFICKKNILESKSSDKVRRMEKYLLSKRVKYKGIETSPARDAKLVFFILMIKIPSIYFYYFLIPAL